MRALTPKTPLVVSPTLAVRRLGEEVLLESGGTYLECSAGVLDALALLQDPVSLEQLAERIGKSLEATGQLLAPLLDGLFIVPQPLARALAVGATRPAARCIGMPLPFQRLGADAAPGIAIVGAPVGMGAGPEGLPSHGPHLVRQAFPTFFNPPHDNPLLEKWQVQPGSLAHVQDLDFRRRYAVEHLPRVFDVGDVMYQEGEGLELYGQRLGFVLERLAANQLRPFLIGGDHSLTRFAAGALLERHEALGIIHFDAHHDMYKGLPAAPLSHANPFAHLITDPRLASLLQVGLRSSFEQIDASLSPVSEPKLRYVSALECQTASAREIFGGLRTDIPYYLSFDIDVLDPIYAPETGMPELGGLSYYQCITLVDYVARHFNLVGMDLVEVAGSERRVNWAARIGARVMAQAVLGSAAFQPLETHLFQRR